MKTIRDTFVYMDNINELKDLYIKSSGTQTKLTELPKMEISSLISIFLFDGT